VAAPAINSAAQHRTEATRRLEFGTAGSSGVKAIDYQRSRLMTLT